MNASSTGFLCQTGDEFLDLLAHHHHQVSQLIDHHHDVGQAVQRFRIIGREAERIGQSLAVLPSFIQFVVVTRQIAHTQLAHQLVTTFHFTNTPIQAIRGLPHVGNNRGQQMRYALIDRHF